MRSMCAVIGHSELRTVYTSPPTIIRVTVKALRFSLLFYQFYVRGLYSLLAGCCVIHLGCRVIAQMFFFGKYTVELDVAPVLVRHGEFAGV